MSVFSTPGKFSKKCIMSVLVFLAFIIPQTGLGQQLVLIPNSNEGQAQISFQEDLVIGGNSDSPIMGTVSSVAVNSKGNIFVSDTRIPCIYKFNNQGKLLAQFGQEGDGPGDLTLGTRIGIDSLDRIFVAGMSGDVHIMDSSWNYIGGFQRENPGNMVRSILVSKNEGVMIATLGIMEKTTIDSYTPDHLYSGSFAKTFANENDDWRYESAYAGGYIFRDFDDSILFAQLSPYELRRYNPNGDILNRTDEGGSNFVLDPPKPDFNAKRVSIKYLWGTSGIVSFKNGEILTSSWRVKEDGQTQSLFCLYNAEFELIGRSIFQDYHTIKGIDKDDMVFLCSEDDLSNRISRSKIILR